MLRSKSDHPAVAANRDVLHKIGVTGCNVARRIANARLDPTFLMADVEIVATYELYNINRARLENLIHRIFGPARFDIEIKDRFGQPVIPREWVPRAAFRHRRSHREDQGRHDHRLYLRPENRLGHAHHGRGKDPALGLGG